jgi:hypothetical protein
MNDTAADIRELQRGNAALREELSRLRPAPLPPPTLGGPFRAPNRKQIEALTGIALRRFPCLRRPPDRAIDDRFHGAVAHGMAYLGTVNRLPEGKVDSQGEAGTARLSGGQSVLHQAFCVLCGPALSGGDDQGRG